MARGDRLFVLILICLLLLNPLSYSQTADTSTAAPTTFSPDESYDWLYGMMINTSIAPEDTDRRALAIIALMQRGSGSFSGLLTELRELEDETQHCWPNTGCTVKDTALATLALALAGDDVEEEITWLKTAKVAGLPATGEWAISIKSDSDGVCEFNFPGASAPRQFTLEGDRVRTSGGYTQQQYYVRLNEINPTLASTLQPEITVNCEVTNPIITLFYKPDLNTYFIQSDAGASVTFSVPNACYGNAYRTGPCNYDSTAYTTWALIEIGKIRNDPDLVLDKIGTRIYLNMQAINKREDPVAMGLFNRILIMASSTAPSFINDLVDIQRVSDGSWGNSVVATSIASFGLTGSDRGDAVGRGLDYLRGAVNDDGSWNGDVEATSWALIALHGGDLSRVSVPVVFDDDSGGEICGNGFDDDSDGILDCGEIECSSDLSCNMCNNGIQDEGEDGLDCGGECPFACFGTGAAPDCTIAADCLSGEVCISGRCVVQATTTPDEEEPECVDDIDCDEGYVCEESTCVPEEEGSLLWLWILIIILVLGGFAFFYVKYVRTGKVSFGDLFRKKPKKPTFEEFRRESVLGRPQPQRPAARAPPPPRMAQPRSPASPATKPKEDAELERSMREAEKILKGE